MDDPEPVGRAPILLPPLLGALPDPCLFLLQANVHLLTFNKSDFSIQPFRSKTVFVEDNAS